MGSIHVHTALTSSAGFSGIDPLTRSGAASAIRETLQSQPRSGGLSQSGAARPGPPQSGLDLRTQTEAQGGAAEEVPAAEAPAVRNTQDLAEPRTNANGEEIGPDGLTEAERREVEKLKARDREVRAHERAHATVGGGIAGPPQYTFVRGPDGKQYAVGGEVSIDTSPVAGNPEATIRKMELVKRAALAPSNPSGQDRRVAAEADAKILAARQEIAQERREEAEKAAEKREERQTGEGNAIGQVDPIFDPESRFRPALGGVGGPLGTGLAGSGDLNMDTGVLSAGELFNLVA